MARDLEDKRKEFDEDYSTISVFWDGIAESLRRRREMAGDG